MASNKCKFMEKLVLIDGNSLIYRAFYAMPLFVTKKGVYTNAVYGFMNMLSKILADVKPTHVVVAFDRKEPTFRHGLFKDYKATRKPMPDELVSQVPLLKKVLKAMNVKTVEKAGLEADDIIGAYAKKTDVNTIIITGDRDSFQLVDETTSVYLTKKGISELEVYSAENFKEKTGINPSQVIELKALMGDASDNIPGVAGVGEKTALSLLNDYKTLYGVYENIASIKGKLKEKLEAEKELAYLSRSLATIDVNADIEVGLADAFIKIPFGEELKSIFTELEFNTLLNKKEFFSETLETSKKALDVEVVVAEEITEDLINEIKNGPEFAFVLSSESISVYNGIKEYNFPLCVSLLEDGFSAAEVIGALSFLFEKDRVLTVYDKKSLRHTLKKSFGVEILCDIKDVSLMKYLCDFSGKAETIEESLSFLGLVGEPKAFALKKAERELYSKLVKEDMLTLYEEVELPLADVLYEMEVSGFKVDAESLAETGKKYALEIAELESKIRELTGEENLNVNSPKQLGEVLFEKLKIAKGKKTKTGYSTKVDVLESLEDKHPVVPLILKHRKLQKLCSTYVEGFKPLIEKSTGLIHTSFNQTVTATGRLSSREPNLQNIPVRDEEGRELRKFFVPKSADRILIGADYSQIELRLLAAFSNCESLIQAFKSGEDIHTETAARVFGVKMEEVTPTMRRSAKAVNFGIIYGISEYGLAKNIGVTPKEARAYIDSYFKTYPEVKEYMNSNVEFVKKNGYAITLLKRRRVIREMQSDSFALRSFGERAAMNMPLQGSSADIIKVAMLKVMRRLKEENLRSELILQIHDELIIDAFKSEKEKVEKILKEEMENAVKLKVPLTVEVGAGENWYLTK